MSNDVAVEYILGSHRWGVFQPRHFVDASPYEGTDHMPPMPDIRQLVQQSQARSIKFDVRPGDALVFDARIIHGSP
eukprot:CAMPEP_0194226384 /NCGR_PEP_ID=MMETSP0156-20130528/41730_1 /TAXON_ID=33649 /ORGANISM="Thalassionema nitzschioides, Strain L26-B" /LENGTH=75 /DNA_ID=CAMNT_0038958723 /DNA_START=1 /DNA_END=224 /DNA_ORIENTATION=-